MSSYIVKVIPKDEQYVPDDGERRMILNQLKHLTSSNIEISDQVYEEVSFIDAGSNFEGIQCNFCLSDLDTEWWTEQMEVSSALDFSNLIIETPCCASAVSLNQLKYRWPVGFARYVIEILNPEESEVVSIEKHIANIDYKLIRAHY